MWDYAEALRYLLALPNWETALPGQRPRQDVVRPGELFGALELGAVTSYEAATALSLLHFAEERVDAAVLEVGLGGRLDATNAVAAPIAVLTPIALDHMEVLGDTLAAIATEKADVMKPAA